MVRHKARSCGGSLRKIDWALKTNGRLVAKQMPLLSESPGYSEWGKEATRWAKPLYNRPVSSEIDYVIINLRESSEITDKESSGHLEHKLQIKGGENEAEAIKNRVVSEPINIEWAFDIFNAMHHEPEGAHIPIFETVKCVGFGNWEGARNRGGGAGGRLGLTGGGKKRT